MEKKYKMEKAGDNLFRIVALKDFGDVKKGDIGGFIEKEENLSHEGLCWISDNAVVCDNAKVSGNARVSRHAYVKGSSIVSGDATVSGEVSVSGNSIVEERAVVVGYSNVKDHARVSGKAVVKDNAMVLGTARVSGNAKVKERARVEGNALVTGNAVAHYTQVVRYGKLAEDIYKNKNWKQGIYNLYGLVPIKNRIILYKKVNNDLSSSWATTFKYPKKGVIEVKEYNKDITAGCASGLHFADPDYWNEGDTLLAAEIDLDDIITIQRGKVRVKKAHILGIVAKTDENGDLIL
ncbi:MAG TPA: polymer-forming cytoskeletal protein [Bacteroidales bacterium]|nr:polymer-forming cytoskeletal protein [Bacteroidales bacterium]